MLSVKSPSVYQAGKCFVTYGTMGHLDPDQLPIKGKPWSTVLAQDFVHKVDLIIPQDSYEAVQQKILDAKPPPEYQRVIMTLGEILSGDFFKEYIKIGHIMMLSEGRVTVDNVLTIKNGLLTMFLDRETYERCGITGKSYGNKGKRGLKPRWIIECDLKAPFMWPGKKGFDRLIYACKNVLNKPITWLFCNVRDIIPNPDPLAPHFPAKFTSAPGITTAINVNLPPLQSLQESVVALDQSDFQQFATEIHEWLSLVRLGSPRIVSGDSVDPFLSRYQVSSDPEQHQSASLCRISWEGFLSPKWVRQLLADVILSTLSKSWFALSSTTFSQSMASDNKDYTILRPPENPGEYMLWDVHSHV